MARYTREQIVSDPFVAEFVAFGAGTGNQKVYTLRASLQNIIGNPDLEDSIRGIFGMEPQEFITVCQARSDLDKQFTSVA